MTELEKMIAGELYNAEVPDLQAMRTRAAQLCHQLEQLSPTEGEARLALLKELLGKTGEHLTINHGFKCDYGSNITVGEHFYANYNLVVLDCAPVVFGENVFIAPQLRVLHRRPSPGRPHPQQRPGICQAHYRGRQRMDRRQRDGAARCHHRQRVGDRRGQRGGP